MAQIPQEVRDSSSRNAGQAPYPYPPPQPAAGYYGVPGQYGANQVYAGYPQAPYPPAYGSQPPGYPMQQQMYQSQPIGYPQHPHQAQIYGQEYGDTTRIGVNDETTSRAAGAGASGWFGNYDDEYWNIEEEKKLTEDIDVKIRMAFVRKVYGILSVQLLVTFGLALWFNLHRVAAVWLIRNPWVMIVGVILMCASVCTLTCVPKTGRKVPLNYLLLLTLALAMGVILGYSTGAVDTPAFAMAVGMTAAVTIAVSLFACQTKWDFTGCGVYAFVAIILLMIFGLVAAFVRNRITHIVYASLGAALFSFYLIMDTQKIVGGKHRQYQFSIDDYAFAALSLYLDIINLFMYILQIIALADR